MKKLIISSIVALLFLSCSVSLPDNSSLTPVKKDTSSPSPQTPLLGGAGMGSLHLSLIKYNFDELEKEYKAFSTKALSDAYVSRMFTRFLTTGTANPTQVIRQLEFARYMKDVKSDSSYVNSLKAFIGGDIAKFNLINNTIGVSQKKSAESATFGVFVDTLNPNFNNIVTSGLVLNLDAGNVASYQGTGSTWTDLSSNGNNGILTNGPSFSSANNGSLVFDGLDDYVSSLVVEPVSSFTIEFWFKMTGPPTNNDAYGGVLIASSPQSFNSVLQYCISVSYQYKRIHFFIESNVGRELVTGNNVVNLNTWYNTIFVYNGSTRKIYLNGNLIASDSYNTNPIYPISGDKNVQIGRWGFTGYQRNFNGNISVARIYGNALSSNEVQQNYNALKARYGL